MMYSNRNLDLRERYGERSLERERERERVRERERERERERRSRELERNDTMSDLRFDCHVQIIRVLMFKRRNTENDGVDHICSL